MLIVKSINPFLNTGQLDCQGGEPERVIMVATGVRFYKDKRMPDAFCSVQVDEFD